MIDNQLLEPQKKQIIVIAYNKPKGIICTTEKIKDNIIDAVAYPEKIYPIGRLDKDSEGLILLTNHNALIDTVANPKFEHEKEYLVTLNLPIRNSFIKAIEEGIDIGIGVTKPAKASIVEGTKRVLEITLEQGLNRQIRKMCNVHNYQVLKLQRIRVMNIHLNDLNVGKWRLLSEDEINSLMELNK
jgi:23S rRNA pseudouridine2604 synthase